LAAFLPCAAFRFPFAHRTPWAVSVSLGTPHLSHRPCFHPQSVFPFSQSSFSCALRVAVRDFSHVRQKLHAAHAGTALQLILCIRLPKGSLGSLLKMNSYYFYPIIE
jgi:hypothetical protein